MYVCDGGIHKEEQSTSGHIGTHVFENSTHGQTPQEQALRLFRPSYIKVRRCRHSCDKFLLPSPQFCIVLILDGEGEQH